MSVVRLQQHILGMEPYVLLTAFLGDDGEDDLRMNVEFGGGPDSMEEARGLVLLALPEMGLTSGELDTLSRELDYRDTHGSTSSTGEAAGALERTEDVKSEGEDG
jgi:hypothetical protein